MSIEEGMPPEAMQEAMESQEVLVNRPKKLYRGFIPKSPEQNLPIQSDPEALKKVIESGGDPHDLEYANKFVWTTPDKKYAQGVTVCRFMIDMATKPDFRTEVEEGTASIPTLAEYDIDDDVEIYDAEGNTLQEFEKNEETKQVIIDSVDPEAVHTTTLVEGNIEQLMEFLDEPTNSNFDTIARGTMLLDEITNSNYRMDEAERIGKLTMGETLSDAFDFYTNQRGVDDETARELLSKGFFSGSLHVRDMARNATFR